jgi:hypothetical protein
MMRIALRSRRYRKGYRALNGTAAVEIMGMAQEMKPVVGKEEVFDKLEIRVGKVIDAELEPSAPMPSYRMVIDSENSASG